MMQKTGGNKWDFGVDKMPAENITLYAQFTINSYTASFDNDGKLTTQKVTYQSLLEEPAAPTKTGYTFKGWYDAKTGGTKWDFATGKMRREILHYMPNLLKMIAQIQMIQPLIPQQEMVMVQAIQAIQEAIPHFQQLVTKIPCFRFYRGFLARNSNANSPQNNQSEITIKTAEVYSFFIDFSCFC